MVDCSKAETGARPVAKVKIRLGTPAHDAVAHGDAMVMLVMTVMLLMLGVLTSGALVLGVLMLIAFQLSVIWFGAVSVGVRHRMPDANVVGDAALFLERAPRDSKDLADGTPREQADCELLFSFSSMTLDHTPSLEITAAVDVELDTGGDQQATSFSAFVAGSLEPEDTLLQLCADVATPDNTESPDGTVTRTGFGDVLHVCCDNGIHMDIAICGFWRQHPRRKVQPAVPERQGMFPYIPDATFGLQVLNRISYIDTLPGGCYVDVAIPPLGWSDSELQIKQRLGTEPPFEDTVPHAEYQARYFAAVRDDPPPGVLGARLEYMAEEALQHLAQAITIAASPIAEVQDDDSEEDREAYDAQDDDSEEDREAYDAEPEDWWEEESEQLMEPMGDERDASRSSSLIGAGCDYEDVDMFDYDMYDICGDAVGD